MNTKLLLASIVGVMAAAPAYAQETPSVGGLRVEARIGIDRPVITIPGDSAGKTGLSYGAEIGYDANLNGFTIGAYAGIDGSTAKECTEVFGGDEACLKAGRNFTAGARLGHAMARGLVYVKGGYSNGRATVAYRDFVVPANDFSASEDLDGFHIGLGYEHNFSGKVYGKLEYVYTNYNTDNSVGLNVDLQRHQGLVGVGMRF